MLFAFFFFSYPSLKLNTPLAIARQYALTITTASDLVSRLPSVSRSTVLSSYVGPSPSRGEPVADLSTLARAVLAIRCCCRPQVRYLARLRGLSVVPFPHAFESNVVGSKIRTREFLRGSLYCLLSPFFHREIAKKEYSPLELIPRFVRSSRQDSGLHVVSREHLQTKTLVTSRFVVPDAHQIDESRSSVRTG